MNNNNKNNDGKEVVAGVAGAGTAAALGGAALGAGTALIFTRPYKMQNAEISISPTFGSGRYGISAVMRLR